MGSAAKSTLTVTLKAEDHASAEIRKVEQEVKQFPKHFQHASAAMSALGSVVGGLEGKLGETVGKVAGLATMMATGGVLGVAIGAASLGFAGLNAYIEDFNKDIEAAEIMTGALGKSHAATAAAVLRTRDQLEGAKDQLAAFGKTGVAADLVKINNEYDRQSQKVFGLINLQREYEDRLTSLSEKGADLAGFEVQSTIASLDSTKKEIDLTRERMGLLAQIQGVEKQLADKEAAKKRVIDLENVHNLKLKEREQIEQQLAAEAAKHYEEQAALLGKEAEDEKKRAIQIAAVVQEVGAIWGNAFASMINGSENAGKATLRATVQSVRAAVMAYAAQAMAAAIAGNSAIPVVGVAAGIAAGGIAFSAVEALIDRIPAAAKGGVVTGGTPGRDSVPAMLMPGELVVPTGDVKRLSQGGGLGGTNITIVAPQSTTFPDQGALTRHLVNHVRGALHSALADGQIRIPRSALVG